ncbi:hypothetical protein [Erythrobacter crassostreae]|uniref:Integron n=1 Tax=Erythrobacter crassostreae TaxID=2828328 RepID=A0A9X1F0T7_9SPHN|nr:hypothetical protein [Erythrobacter crassostrea]MBV7257957.1 hypothetical protein [Erythrobacter crassostrea]
MLSLQACTPPTLNVTLVQIGGEEEFDACPGVGRMAALPGSDAPLEVRARPEFDAPVTGYVDPGAFVWMCELTDDRAWHGVLYSHREDDRIPCEVSSPIAERQDYSGPCQQGWVPDETIVLFAD